MAALTVTAAPKELVAAAFQESDPLGDEGSLMRRAELEALFGFAGLSGRATPAAAGHRAEDNFPGAGTPEWGRMNRRRAELIRKKIRGELNEQERELYETLQRRSLEELERAYPRGRGEPEG